jgi:hypothetical protein
VYDWKVSQLPAEAVLGMDRVEQLVQQVHAAATVLYKQQDQEQDGVRRRLVETVPEFESFSRTHPRLFLLLTEKNSDPAHRMHVLNLIAMKRKHQQQGISLQRQQQEVSSYMHSHFVREAAPGEEEAAVAAGTGLRGTVVSSAVSSPN